MCPTLSLLLLLSITGCVELITVTAPHKHVSVMKGGSALLECAFVSTEDTTGLTIQWEFSSVSSMASKQIYYYQGGEPVIQRAYKDRIEIPSDPGTSKNVSIVIKDMQPSDTGTYTCEVHNFPDVEGQSQANIIVNVLERPSVPYCSVHGDVESGHLVTLTCHSEHGSPAPTYIWTRLDQARTRRPVLGMTTQTGILLIRNISQFEFGEYQCNATNAVGFSSCTVELSPELGDGVIAGAVIGALLGCVLIVLVVWFIAHTLKRKKYRAVQASELKEMKRSSHQAQEAPERVPVATRAGSLHDEADEARA